MFKIGDQVRFGVRASGVRRARVDGRDGGILRLNGEIIAFENGLYVVKHHGNQIERYHARLYNLRKLKRGWVVEGERDDPKGRLHMTLECQ